MSGDYVYVPFLDTRIGCRWQLEDVRSFYSRCVDFYVYLLSLGARADDSLSLELQEVIEISFDRIFYEGTSFGDDSLEADRAFDEWYEMVKDYRKVHPEWYTQNALEPGVL